jgi:aminoglycoside phosphotransferase (APT) family kinase protein
MQEAARPRTAFTGLTAGHPLAAELGPLLDRVAADPLLTARAVPPGAAVSIRRDVRVDLRAERRGEITRFLWCTQWRDTTGTFHARTLLYDRGHGEPAVFDFPHDPRLPAAAAPGSPLADPAVEVLRYIPRQRITFRAGDAVGKLKRPTSLARSYARLRAAFAAARRQETGLRVPEPRAFDGERGVYYQELMSGRAVGEVLTPQSAEATLRALGAAHRALHRLGVEGVPARDPDALVAAARDDADWIGFAAPEQAQDVAGLAAWLTRELGVPGDAPRCFCHGDLSVDQVLFDGSAFAVVDFDDAALGDPHEDLGAMIAALPYDAASLYEGPDPVAPRAIAAYLDGYRGADGGGVDERRLRAHRVRGGLTLLARRLRKGQAGPEEVARTVARLRADAGG